MAVVESLSHQRLGERSRSAVDALCDYVTICFAVPGVDGIKRRGRWQRVMWPEMLGLLAARELVANGVIDERQLNLMVVHASVGVG